MKKVKNYIILGIVDIIGMWAFLMIRDVFNVPSPKYVFQILSDGFFTLGVLNFGFGALTWINDEGFFDIIAFGTRQFFGFFFKELNKYTDLMDYKEEKHGERHPFAYLLIYGAVFLGLAYLFLRIFNNM